jgi:phosphoribosyl-AMP cyclohydrolase
MENLIETGLLFTPKFDTNGLITAVITNAADGAVLMVGHMNAAAVEQTLATQTVHFFSRRRQTLWQKGESSGNVLHVAEILVDCDQDALWIKAHPAGPTCHTGATSCFYRRLTVGGLQPV